MENPIWFNFGKLEGDEGGRKCCLACVRAADCISLSLETHFPSQLLGVCHYRNGGDLSGGDRCCMQKCVAESLFLCVFQYP